VGGQPFFDRLVAAFYERVLLDQVLLAMYPDPSDLESSRRHLALFLSQYWGGPSTYSEERGHPRLRLRHVPFEITAEARDHWLVAMTSAIDEAGTELSDTDRADLLAYVDMAAHQLRNR
jgi:hemoglobin